jgi:hypothetical protein
MEQLPVLTFPLALGTLGGLPVAEGEAGELEQEVRGFILDELLKGRSNDEISGDLLRRWGATGIAVAVDFASELENLAPRLNRQQRRRRKPH